MMPLNNYSFFYALHHSDLKGMEKINKYIHQYSLFGFVIYDEKLHSDLSEKIEQDWVRLDEKSGGKFMFFTVVEQKTEMNNYFKGRKYFKPLEKLVNESRSIGHPVQTLHGGTAFSLATFLNINPDKLPVIIVSADINFSEWQVIPLDHQNINDKISKIGDLAYKISKSTTLKIGERRLTDELLNNYIISDDDLNLTPNGVNLIKGLYDFLSLYEAENPSNEHKLFSSKAKVHRSQLYNGFTAQIDNLKIIENKSYETDLLIENLLLKVASILSVKKLNSSDNNLIQSWHHNTSKMYLETFDKISRDIHLEDYSAVGLPLAKSFEKEVILSYYNWLRKIKGIPMPEFYNVPYKKGPIICASKLDLDYFEKSELIPPGLGQIISCLQKVCKGEAAIDFHSNDELEPMISTFFKINDLRKKIAHANNIFTKENLSELEKKISEVYNGPYGLHIKDLKEDLAGNK